MYLRIRNTVFIDELIIEVHEPKNVGFTALLKDDKGNICRSLELETGTNQSSYKWHGLNELPYGLYTCEIYGGDAASKTRLVKRL
jgi:hypothetical protein